MRGEGTKPLSCDGAAAYHVAFPIPLSAFPLPPLLSYLEEITLRLLDGYDATMRDELIDFLLDAQIDEGGFRANTRIPTADVLSTFTGLLTLGDLQALHEIDVAAARRYVQSMELPSGGFLGGIWDEATDVEYTFYGLGGLALLATQPD